MSIKIIRYNSLGFSIKFNYVVALTNVYEQDYIAFVILVNTTMLMNSIRHDSKVMKRLGSGFGSKAS